MALRPEVKTLNENFRSSTDSGNGVKRTKTFNTIFQKSKILHELTTRMTKSFEAEATYLLRLLTARSVMSPCYSYQNYGVEEQKQLQRSKCHLWNKTDTKKQPKELMT
jgi:hypothetical protein